MRGSVLYLRFVAFSIAAIALSACARLSLSDPTMFEAKPVLGDPPVTRELVGPVNRPVTVADVERQLAALDSQIVNLKHALQIMSPKATTEEFAVSGSGEPSLYAPAPDLPQAKSLFRWADSCTSFTTPSNACSAVEPVRAAN